MGQDKCETCGRLTREGDGAAYLSIAIKPDMDISIRYDARPRLVIRWKRNKVGSV